MSVDDLLIDYADELSYISAMGYDGDTAYMAIQVADAYDAIRAYLWLDADADMTAYFRAACELAAAYYINNKLQQNKLSGDRTVTQQSEGSRSVTYSSADVALDSHGLTEKVKAMLHPPFLRVL